MRLREHPEDARLKAERDAFLARGEAERAAYAQVVTAWEGSGRKLGPNKSVIIAAMLGVLVSVYIMAEPLRTYLMADFQSGDSAQDIVLAAGDRAVLDAHTAVSDDTEANTRRVTLIEGAAVFDVDQETRSFVVSAGDVTIEVLGTTFEALRMNDTVAVAVEEGRVRIRAVDASWTLNAGDRLIWSQASGGVVSQIEMDAVAPWRNRRFVADGLTFSEVATVIDRHLPGRIVITSAALAEARVMGTINLEDPKRALDALVAAKGARVISAGSFAHVVMP